MGIYNIEVFLNEFSSRTIKNLKFIDDHVGYSDVFEVTQLINSLLGLIIIPVEKYKRNYLVNDTRLKEVSIADYLKIKNIIKKCKEDNRWFCDYPYKSNNTISDFINHIRNSIAHGGCNGIHFYPVSDAFRNRITDIVFYDNDSSKYKGKKVQVEQSDRIINEFCIKLNLNELKELVNAISNLYCKFEKMYDDYRLKEEEYNRTLDLLNMLMKKEKRDDKTKPTIAIENESLE